MPDYGLGRLHAPDDRDCLYPASLVLERLSTARRTTPWKRERVLDQGPTGTCVGHGWRGWLESEPTLHTAGYGRDAFSIYRQAILLDEWPENDAEETLPDNQLQSGTSVRAGAKAMQQDGYIQNYVWATRASQVADFLTRADGAAVVLGTNWYTGMFSPNRRTGTVRMTGGIAGGHCYYAFWWDGRYFWCQNSWGDGWSVTYDGIGGVFRLSAGQLDRLLKEHGEACLGVEYAVAP
jgi:hypothetical protein